MSNIKILVVEDQLLHAEQLVNYLRRLGYQYIKHTQTGENAIRIAPIFEPDLLLMDVELPRINGIETVKQIHRSLEVPVIYISGEREKYLEDALETKLNAFIQKPFNPADLKAQIKIALKEHNLKNQQYAFVKNRNAHDKIILNNILWIEANRAYCRIRLKNRTYTLGMNLKTCEERLLNSYFVRVHDSFIVNIHHIQSTQTINRRKYLFISGLESIEGKPHTSMDQGENLIPISRTYANNLKRFFKKL